MISKNVCLLALLLISRSVFAQFPITKTVEINKLEVYPSAEGPGTFAAYLVDPMPEAGCPHNGILYIEYGPGQEAAYSSLLAAKMADKQIEIYATRCTYGIVVDRVRVKF